MAAQEAVHSTPYVKNDLGSNGYDYVNYPPSEGHHQYGNQHHHYNPYYMEPPPHQHAYPPQPHPYPQSGGPSHHDGGHYPSHHYGHHSMEAQNHFNMMPGPNHAGMYKEEPTEADPYSFVDEDSMMQQRAGSAAMKGMENMAGLSPNVVPKKRGRKKKSQSVEEFENGDDDSIPPLTMDLMPSVLDADGQPSSALKRKYTKSEHYKQRRRHDRFNGMTEDEVRTRTLPDHLASNLDVVIIGINPGLFAAYKGHHYAGPGNHFWKCLFLAGLVPEPMTADDDFKLLHFGIGFTNMVARPTKGSADLTRKEIREGGRILLEKLQRYQPKIAVFNGKGIYEVFSGKKEFTFGKQPECIDGTNTFIWVMPSSSARCAQLPRAMDKVPFYSGLKKFRDYLNGLIPEIDDSEVIFNDPKIRAADDGTEISEHLKVDSLSSEDLPSLVGVPIAGAEPYPMGMEDPAVPFDPSLQIPVKKKRGRPKKIRIDGVIPVKSTPKPQASTSAASNQDFSDGPPKKKRGRPKKIRTNPADTPALIPHIDMNGSMGSNSNTNHSVENGGPPSASPNPSYMMQQQPHHQMDYYGRSSGGALSGLCNDGSPPQQQQQCSPTSPPSRRADPPPPKTEDPAPPSNYRTPYLTHNQDVASKSLSGLESLVDQIPANSTGPADGVEHQQQHHHQAATFNHYPSSSSFSSYPSSSSFVHHYAPAHYSMAGSSGAFPHNSYNQGPPEHGFGPSGSSYPFHAGSGSAGAAHSFPGYPNYGQYPPYSSYPAAYPASSTSSGSGYSYGHHHHQDRPKNDSPFGGY